VKTVKDEEVEERRAKVVTYSGRERCCPIFVNRRVILQDLTQNIFWDGHTSDRDVKLRRDELTHCGVVVESKIFPKKIEIQTTKIVQVTHFPNFILHATAALENFGCSIN